MFPQIDIPPIIKKLLNKRSSLKPPLFDFQASIDSAQKNWKILKAWNFNLDKALNHPSNSVTAFGSEFKKVSDLQELFFLHPRWKALKCLLEKGADFPLKNLEEELRRNDLQAAYERGNHKSAKKEEAHLAKAMLKEIEKGWILPLPDKKYMDIPGLILNPMGVASHVGVTTSGEFAPKLRVTHDLSFPGLFSGESVNSRIVDDNLEPIMFGHCLLRLIHYIVNLRSRFPSKKIWIRKEDFKSAYRRTNLNGKACFQSAVRVKIKGNWFILISLRLPFGGSPCPNHFCLVSDMITDAINDLLNCKSWNHNEICSKFVKKIPREESLEDSIPFATARELSVNLPPEDQGKADVFIDDIISICVDKDDNLDCLKAAPCTIIHAIANRSSEQNCS